MNDEQKLADEANRCHREVVGHLQSALLKAKEAGENLNKAKELVRARGERFGDWLEKNFEASHEKANMYMRIAREWNEHVEGEYVENPDLSITGAIRYLRSKTTPTRSPFCPLRKPARLSPAEARESIRNGGCTDLEAVDGAKKFLQNELARRITEKMESRDLIDFVNRIWEVQLRTLERREDGLRLTVAVFEWFEEEDGWNPFDNDTDETLEETLREEAVGEEVSTAA